MDCSCRSDSAVPDISKFIGRIESIDRKIEGPFYEGAKRLQFLCEKSQVLIETIDHLRKMHITFAKHLNHAAFLETLSKVSDHANDLFLQLESISRRHRYYTSKLKSCVRIYSKFNEKLFCGIQSLKRQLQSSNKHINVNLASKEEFDQMDAKIKRYNKVLLSLEAKNPWLRNPDFKLPGIMLEVNKLEHLQKQHSELLCLIDDYNGLNCIHKCRV